MPFLLGSEEHTSELQSPCNLVCRFCFDRKSTRLNSSHLVISYAVFCLKKKNTTIPTGDTSAALSPSRPWNESVRTPRSSQACLDIFFFFNDTATTEIYTLSLHDALPI